MRPLRLLILLTCFIALPIFLTCISLVTAHPRNGNHVSASSRTSRFRALFNFQAPTSLFPPSAMISLTDDNTTFFIAKPADFGPSLPSKGLNGQLWIGMGFSEDLNKADGVLVTAEGELGCSDVPGWDGGSKRTSSPPTNGVHYESAAGKKSDGSVLEANAGNHKEADKSGEKDKGAADPATAPGKDDGTDDYLHHPLPESGTAHSPNPARPQQQDSPREKGNVPAHADIQSLQESAEIAGKIVLLSRGGCGFLEKVKWAQRRGAIAVIVGDNARHGSLLTMYGRGDTSNITIPSVFTSHTTAHLLSSLMPPEASDDPKDPKQQSNIKAVVRPDPKKQKTESNEPSRKPSKSEKKPANVQVPMSSITGSQSRSWVRSLMHVVGLGDARRDAAEDTRRPPSSGNIDWVLVEDFEEEDSKSSAARKKTTSSRADKSTTKDHKKSAANQKHSDDFVIGEQDWRDPDLLKPDHKLAEIEDKKKESSKKNKEQKDDDQSHRLKGGSITPGSGEYSNPVPGKPSKSGNTKDPARKEANPGASSWVDWFRPSETSGHEHSESRVKQGHKAPPEAASQSQVDGAPITKEPPSSGIHDREGLWITLTPTSMSTSPFLDTLLVLVVSPLVTLTVVYGLLLLRSRIRRRRWRAPKSVVDRLPVRTYHTISTSAVSSQLASPENASPTTPLLRASASTRSRPRSRTASSVPTTNVENFETPSLSATPLEKNTMASPWRRRYTGRQVECVVCLEEYVDGQSRVMSLPCGHEFHAECITPWLTTRRRTCPICKGDVVRSMAQMGSASSATVDGTNRVDDAQDLAAGTRNDSPSAAIPIPRGEAEDEDDLEGGGEERRAFIGDHRSRPSRRSWRNLLSLSALSGDTIWGGRSMPVDRNR